MVGARCVSGERQRREGFGAHGGVWEARRWVSRTQFTQKTQPRTQGAASKHSPQTVGLSVEKGETAYTATTQSEVSAGYQEGECDDAASSVSSS